MRPRPSILVSSIHGLLCASCAVLPVFLAPASADAKVVTPTEKKDAAKPPEPPVIMKYLGKQKMRMSGKDVLVIGGINVATGQQMQFEVPNNDPKSNKYDPKTELSDKIDAYQAGDYVKVKSQGNYNEHWLEGIEKYDMKQGEELPGNFIFYDTYPKNDTTPPVQWVELQKFGQTVDAVVPMKPTSDKKGTEADPAMLAAVNTFKKGDVVTVEVGSGNPPVLRSIDVYKAPEEGKIGKVVEADVAGDQKGPAVEVDQNGKTLTLPIKGHLQNKKWQPDAQLLSRAKSLKAGTAILFSTHDEEGKTYLKDLKVAPAAPPPATPAKTGSKRFDK